MPEPSHAMLADRAVDRSSAPPVAVQPATQTGVELAVYNDLAAVEAEWRRFEAHADCTVFQAFDWLGCWQRHIGRLSGACPAIVVGRRRDGETLFLLPLAVTPGIVRRLTFLGSDHCDYNAPMLARDFANQVAPDRFLRLWLNIRAMVAKLPRCNYDMVELTKMPEMVGRQRNPLLSLDAGLNPSGAHATALGTNWDAFYQVKRSSATRRRDRTKRKRLAEFGEVRFVIPQTPADIATTLDTLIAQKTKSFARMGVSNIFARPGCREFFLELATDPRTRALTHVSRLDVGDIPAAVNLGLTFDDSYYHVLASYDDGEISRFGPGAAHLRDLLAHAIGLGCRRFDFTIGDERYKLEWSDEVITLYDHVAPATARGWPLAAFVLARRRLKRLIKQNKLLWSAYSRVRAAFGTTTSRVQDEGVTDKDRATKSPPIAPE